MKTTSGILALLLTVFSIFAISGCVKAQHDYDAYLGFINSTEGLVESFARGFQRGSQGDIFGQALDQVSQERTLAEEVTSGRFLAWTSLICAIVSLTVFMVLSTSKVGGVSSARTNSLPCSTLSGSRAMPDWVVPVGFGLGAIVIGLLVYQFWGFRGLAISVVLLGALAKSRSN